MKNGIKVSLAIVCLCSSLFLVYGCGVTTSSPSGATPKVVFLRGSEWPQLDVYSMNPDGTGANRLTYHTSTLETTNWPKLSPDRTKILYSLQYSGDYGLYVMDINGTASEEIYSSASSVYAAWSPDSSKVAFVDSPDLLVWDGVSGSTVTNDANSGCSVSYSPDSNLILYKSTGNDLHIYVSSLDAVVNVTNNPDSTYSWPVFSPVDNNIIAYKTCMGIYSLDISTGTVTTLETNATHRHICFGPSGQWVYYTLSSTLPWQIKRVKLTDPTSKEAVTSGNDFPASVMSVSEGIKVNVTFFYNRLSPMFFSGSSRLFYVINDGADMSGTHSELYSIDPDDPSNSIMRLTTTSVINCFDPDYWD